MPSSWLRKSATYSTASDLTATDEGLFSMEVLSLLGHNGSTGLVDCTDSLPISSAVPATT